MLCAKSSLPKSHFEYQISGGSTPISPVEECENTPLVTNYAEIQVS